MEFLRFVIVSVVGVVVDLGMSWALAHAGVPLWVAAVAGFAVAATLNYVLHRRWTFGGVQAGPERARVIRYLGALGLTLGARLVAVFTLGAVLGPQAHPMAILLPSVAFSFAVSFIATKFMVFRKGQNGKAA